MCVFNLNWSFAWTKSQSMQIKRQPSSFCFKFDSSNKKKKMNVWRCFCQSTLKSTLQGFVASVDFKLWFVDLTQKQMQARRDVDMRIWGTYVKGQWTTQRAMGYVRRVRGNTQWLPVFVGWWVGSRWTVWRVRSLEQKFGQIISGINHKIMQTYVEKGIKFCCETMIWWWVNDKKSTYGWHRHILMAAAAVKEVDNCCGLEAVRGITVG